MSEIKFPVELDGDEELYKAENLEGEIGTSEPDDIMAEHHNALKNAIQALEEKVGVDNSSVPETLDAKKVNSSPPAGCSKIENIYLDEANQEYVLVI